ncbi:MAG: response regulator [Anaerolineales bacterium]|nr:response regulator [Anaerolineales bacterium]
MAEKVLIVDDDLDTLRLVGLMLQRQGYQIIAASNGPQALVLAEKEKPHLILLDIMMPEMDGYEVARRVRANPITAAIPIIMFTAKSQVEDKVKGYEAGADDYITKPTQPRELFAKMRAVLSRARKAVTGPIAEPATIQERGFLITIIGTKGGIGTTTLTLNLALALHQHSQKEVIAAEYQPGLGTIGVELGYKTNDSLNRLLEHNEFGITPLDVENNLVQFAAGVRILTASNDPLARLKSYSASHYQQITQFLIGMAKYILIDCGVSLSASFMPIYPISNAIFLLAEPTSLSITQFQAIRDALVEQGIHQSRIHALVYNRVRSDMMLTRSQIQEKLGIELLGMITPAPELAYHASLNNRPIYLHQPESATANQFNEIARKILTFA